MYKKYFRNKRPNKGDLANKIFELFNNTFILSSVGYSINDFTSSASSVFAFLETGPLHCITDHGKVNSAHIISLLGATFLTLRTIAGVTMSELKITLTWFAISSS